MYMYMYEVPCSIPILLYEYEYLVRNRMESRAAPNSGAANKEVLWQALPYWRIEGVAQSQRAAAPHHSLTLTASQAGSALSARRQSPAVPRPRRRARAPRPSASCRNYRQNISSYVPLWTLDIKLCRSVLYAERIEVSLQEFGTR